MGCLNSTIKAGSDRGNRTNIQILTGDHIDVNETKPKRDSHVQPVGHLPDGFLENSTPGTWSSALRVSRTGRNPQVELPRILENEDVPEQKSSNSEVLEKKQGLQFERARLEARNAELLQENTDLRLRLSSVMGTRLTTNNPNITDLSDANRPAKLADQFSELYDNEWTDAYVKLEETFESCPLKSRKRVKEICNVLLQILYKTYLECNSKAETEMDALLMAYRAVCGEEVNLEVSKQIKTKRKNNYKCQLQAVSMVVDREISSYIDNHLRLKNAPDVMKRIKPYTDRCLELCWLMVIQDPPVYICCDKITTKMKVDFNKDVYREYTLPGKKIAYVVWPVLYLHKGGPMLKKGIAQGSAKNTQTLTGIGNRKNVQIDQNVKKPMNSTVFVTTVAETTKERPTSEDGEKSDDFMF